VVITVPAYFDEVRRKATHDAGYMAGLDILDVLNEPTAAAVDFGFQQGYLNADGAEREPRRVLIYDLGGGTFDVTLMELSGNQFRMLATDGDVRLGGRDWSQRLVDRISQAFVHQHGIDPRQDPTQSTRLWRDCEEAKRALSIRSRTQFICDYQRRALKLEITRREFEQLTRDLLDRTVFTVRQLMRASRLSWRDLDRVLLVGGATRMPAVAARLEQLTGRQPDRSLSPDESVAHGAALYAAMLLARRSGEPVPFQVQNVNSHSLGVVATVSKSRRSANAVLIPKNTPLPAVQHRVFRTQKPGQRSLLLRIVEGESDDPDQCAQVGQCSVQGLPPDLPAKTPVNVEFAYTESGRLRVRVAIANSSVFTEYPVTRQHSLSPLEIHSWRQIITGDRSIRR
jgi:molecular chaperone DnaK